MSAERQHDPQPVDAQPDPEPAAPSLPEPDPGVFHHEPGTPAYKESGPHA